MRPKPRTKWFWPGEESCSVGCQRVRAVFRKAEHLEQASKEDTDEGGRVAFRVTCWLLRQAQLTVYHRSESYCSTVQYSTSDYNWVMPLYQLIRALSGHSPSNQSYSSTPATACRCFM